MRNALLGSTVTHLAVLAALFAVRAGTPLVVPGPDVVQVSLLDPAAAPRAVAPAPPEQEPRREVPDIAPEQAEGVKLVKPKPEPRKPAPREEERPSPDAPAAALPYAAVGNAGLRGQLAVDAADFEFTYYLLLVRNRIASSWSPPAGLATGGRPVRCVVRFRIERDGSVTGAQLESPSGVDFFDRSATRAVLLSDPLPPLPLGFGGGGLGVHFGFEYTAP